MSDLLLFGVIVLFLLIVLLPATVRVVWQYEAGVVFRLGRLVGTRPPGIRIIIPFVDTMRKIDTRVVVINVPAQEVITKDNVTLKVDAIIFFRVIHPEASIIEVADFRAATFQIAQTTLRSVLGKSDLDELLAHRETLNLAIREIIDEHTAPWGMKVTAVEVKDVELPPGMQRAMAAQAEAAHIIATEPAALQLRYLQTLTTIATEKTNTIVFPLPIDIMTAFIERVKKPS